MRFLFQISTSALLLYPTSAHYLFGRLIFNNTITKTWEYVREVGPFGGADIQLVMPQLDVLDENIICGRLATTTGSKTKTAVVQAGELVGFRVGEPAYSTKGDDLVFHTGPISMWLSKAPSDEPGALESYKGDGDWFKIAQETIAPPGYGNRWFAEGTFLRSWNVTIPSSTPPGKYLIRIEQFYPIYDKKTQFYVNCAHIEIVGGGGGRPGPLVKIPGVYRPGQEDVFFDASGGYDVKGYVPPYPPVWKG